MSTDYLVQQVFQQMHGIAVVYSSCFTVYISEMLDEGIFVCGMYAHASGR